MTSIAFFIIVFGSCIGSFLNVIIYRFPRKKSFVLNRSQCPSCKHKLNIFDLYPVLSWLLLRGRCRYCDSSISIRYPFVEISTSLLFLISLESKGFRDNFSSDLLTDLSGWILISYLIVLFFIDIDEMILPNAITFSGSLVGLLIVFYNEFLINNLSYPILLDHLLASLFAFLGISIFSYIVMLIIKKPGLGGGDAKLFAMSGAWLGSYGLEVTIVLSFIISSIFILFGLILGFIKRGEYLPFGPFICISIFLVWFFGPQFWFQSLGDIFWWKYL